MAIQIPDFAGTHCQIMSLCGEMQTKDKAILGWLDKRRKWRTARVELPGGPLFVRVGMGGQSGRHCHFDVALPSQFEKEPKTSATKDELQNIVNKLQGITVQVSVRGRFIEESSSLHSSIRATMRSFGTTADKRKIRFTGATLSIEKSVIKSLSWEALEDDEDKVKIEVKARFRLKMTDSYLLKMFDLISRGEEILLEKGTRS
jgi:hypothetical protein